MKLTEHEVAIVCSAFRALHIEEAAFAVKLMEKYPTSTGSHYNSLLEVLQTYKELEDRILKGGL